MKRIVYFLAVAVLAVVFTGCGGMFNKPDYTAADLSGTWVEEYTLCYWVYSLEKDDSGDNYWGKTWDESDDVFETDLEWHGNGWFKWNIANNKLTQLHVMEIGSALVPKTYTVTSCNETTLVLKDTYGNQTTYKKVK